MRVRKPSDSTRPVTGTGTAWLACRSPSASLAQRGVIGMGRLRPPSWSRLSKKMTSRSSAGVRGPKFMPYSTSTGWPMPASACVSTRP